MSVSFTRMIWLWEVSWATCSFVTKITRENNTARTSKLTWLKTWKVMLFQSSLKFSSLHSRSRRLCFVSVRFLSSVNISKSYISDMTRPILTRLGHKYRLTIPFMSYDQIGVKGHVGVTGVKKVIFTKKSFKSNRLRSVITWLMYMIDLDPLYKSYGSRKSSGVIWGHWGQKFIFPKNAITRQCYIAWP